jgi:ribosomal protein L32
MPAFLTRLFERLKAKADRSAAGTAVPAGLDPNERRGPTARERMLMRRRLRRLGSGAEPDAEAEALRRALDERQTLDDLLASGAVTRCPSCGELSGRRDRTCSNCGAQLASEQPTERHSSARDQNRHATAPTTAVTGANSVRSPTPPAR